MYKLELKPNEKVFLVTVSGMVSKDEGTRYLADLESKLKTFNTSEYYLIMDTRELKAGTQDSADNIKNAAELYVRTPFKKRYNINAKSVIANLQIKRVTGDNTFNDVIHVESYEEIFSNKKNAECEINYMFNCG